MCSGFTDQPGGSVSLRDQGCRGAQVEGVPFPQPHTHESQGRAGRRLETCGCRRIRNSVCFPDLGSPASSQRWSQWVGQGSNRGPTAQQRRLSGRPLWTQVVLHPFHLRVPLSPASRLRPLGAQQVFTEHTNEEMIAVSLYFWVSYSLDICLYPKPPLPPPVYIDLC